MLDGLYEKMAEGHEDPMKGDVYCTVCGKTGKVEAAECLATGWPECCGYTMFIGKPEE